MLLLVLCFFVGAAARRAGVLPEDSHRALNAWVLFVSLPALVFRSIHGVTIDSALAGSALCLWLVFAVPAAVAVWWVRRGGPREETGGLALVSGLSNTAFVGLPLIEALGGAKALGPAAVVDQLGSFLALSLFAIPFAASLSGTRPSFSQWVGKLVKSPAMLALFVAVLLADVQVSSAVEHVLNRLADMLSPLALASIGWQFDVSALPGNARRIVLGLVWKLGLAPAMILGLLWLWRGELGLMERVTVAQAAMAPMVTAGVVAAEYRLAPRMAAALVALGVPLSLLTVPLWWHAMEAL